MAPKDGLEHPTTGEDTVESFAKDDVAISNYDESEEFVTVTARLCHLWIVAYFLKKF